jgi:hypothetical protein
MARNGLSHLTAWARQQHQLGVVIVLEREHSNRATYTHVRCLPGPRVLEVQEVADAFEACDQGHVHYAPICTLASPCPCHFWLSRAA